MLAYILLILGMLGVFLCGIWFGIFILLWEDDD